MVLLRVGSLTHGFERYRLMKSARYVMQSCSKCLHAKYIESVGMTSIIYGCWVGRWVDKVATSGSYLDLRSRLCIGCHRVGLNRCKVLAIILAKLGIHVKSFDDSVDKSGTWANAEKRWEDLLYGRTCEWP